VFLLAHRFATATSQLGGEQKGKKKDREGFSFGFR
jgi:hypothetical protein